MTRKRQQLSKRAKQALDACTIPPPIQYDVLSGLLFNRDPLGAADVRGYMKWQASDEKVLHIEQVGSEAVMGSKYKAWLVHTDKGSWWVITPFTNLYSLRLFPSLDYTITFHVGIVARMSSRREAGVPHFERNLLASAWRKWEQAGVALDEADEPEEFQAVGLRCRESLIAMVKALGQRTPISSQADAPKRSDVVTWSEIIGNNVAQGASGEHVRRHLKGVAKTCWQLVGWLTHAENATRPDAELAIDSTQHVLGSFARAQLRHDFGSPAKCVKCGSHRLHVEEHHLGGSQSQPVHANACRRASSNVVFALALDRAITT